MFATQCRGEAFAKIAMYAFILKRANASPLHGEPSNAIVGIFQKTKLSPFLSDSRISCLGFCLFRLVWARNGNIKI